MESLRDSEWRRLIRMVQNDACVLLLGPGVAFDPADRDSPPLSAQLAQVLAEQLDDTHEAMGEGHLAHIAQMYQRENDRVSLELEVEDFYRKCAGQTTEIHRRLAALPLSLCIDLTPAGLMAKAYDEAGKTPLREFYGSERGPAMAFVDFTPERPLVYELFGSLADSASLLLTENDLLDFLVNVAKNTPALPKNVTSRFSDPKTSFLFLGFGFQHWYLRILLHVLKADSDRKNLSLALEDAAFFEHPEQPQTALFYSEQHRIQFRYASWQAFADELSQRFHQESPPDRPAPSTPAVEAPTVFLCHCSEDAEVVAAVSATLQHLGVNTWVDRQNLRGGDHWNRLLGKAINEWVDYFVVLETPAMLGRTESYLYREIDLALERAKGFRQGAKFIFPAQLAACERLEGLMHLQRIDLTSPSGLEQLAQDIRDEWAHRSST
ncbi:MAG: toll/interleukin-1 receptor domain-containing protein [Candidatus Tectomicrobia bacterium]